MPKISVVIPCYNLGKYVHEAINSVIDQTFQDFEIIIINDGSTELQTNQILNDLKLPKLTVITTDNQGLANARNNGILKSSGKYILPLDADDKIAPTYLEKALEVLERKKNIGIVYCHAEFFGEENFEWDLPEYSLSRILIDNLIFASAFFLREDWEIVGGYKSKMIHGWEDYDFWLSIIELQREVYRIPENLFFYRKRKSSMAESMSRENLFYSYKELVNNHKELYTNNIDALFRYIYSLRDNLIEAEQKRLLKDTEIHHLNLDSINSITNISILNQTISDLNKEANDLRLQISDWRFLVRQSWKLLKDKMQKKSR